MTTSKMSSMKQMDSSQTNSISNRSNRKLSWSELRKVVVGARKEHGKMTNMVPFHFMIMKATGNKTTSHIRLLSLGMLPGQNERSLLFADLPLSMKYIPGEIIDWKPAFENYQLNPAQSRKGYSKEEELLRERKRLSSHGITSIEVDSHQKNLLFPANGSLYTLPVGDIGVTPNNGPVEILTNCKGSRMDPKVSPINPDLVAFVNEGDLWVTNISNNTEQQLTFVANSGNGSNESGAVQQTAGVASYICQEEFDRYTGYWWQPRTEKPGKHRIAYEVVDETNVEVVLIPNLLHGTTDSYRYPKAGNTNAEVYLKIAEFETDMEGKITSKKILKMRHSLKRLIPWMEYIVRVDWIPCGQGLWVWVLDRLQMKSCIIYLRLSMFSQVEGEEDDGVNHPPDFEFLYEETNPLWINVHDTYHFLSHDGDDEINFIWASESTGYRHLYLIQTKPFSPNHINTTITPLTAGEWEVSDQAGDMWVDEGDKMIYFMGLKDTPLENNLYKKSYVVNDQVRRITPLGNSHTVTMSRDFRHAIVISSSLSDISSVRLYSISNDLLVDRIDLLAPIGASNLYRAPKLFSFVNKSGDRIHGFIHTPHNMIPAKKYPTVLYVYGGPHVQLVTNAFKVFKNYRLYTLASMGYVVITIDGRGSARRGLKFEGILKERMGQVEIEDQVAGIEYVNTNYGFIDMKRIAIHGWSYGGYLSLVGLLQRPDIFKVAIAGAPVVRWEDYDTAYTERYMSLPSSNPGGYYHGSVLTQVNKFPDEPNRLLLVHGLIDENVHFAHTAQLIQELVRNCKPYDLKVYPSERHGIRNLHSNEQFEVSILSYLQDHL